MLDESLKKEMEILWKFTKGKVRAETIKTHLKYIELKKGKEGVREIEKAMQELGHPIDKAEKMQSLDWIPTALADSIILTAKYVFHWTDKEIFEMGNFAPKFSFIVRLLMKTFVSIKTVFSQTPKYWQEHFTEGKLEAVKFNKRKHYVYLRLYHWCHPVVCVFLSGYFLRIGQYLGKKGMTIKETKCMNNGDPYHEFFIRWEA